MKAAQHSIIASLIGLSFLGFTTTSFAQQDYYKWVDSHGSTHYTTTPPPKVKGVKTRGKIKTYGWSNTAPVTPSNETAHHPLHHQHHKMHLKSKKLLLSKG